MADYPRLAPAEAARMIRHGETVGFGGFPTAGVPKATAAALAERAACEHAAGREFQLGVITVSTGPAFDGALAGAGAIASRMPWQCDAALRAQINAGPVRFLDMHLSDTTRPCGTGGWALSTGPSSKPRRSRGEARSCSPPPPAPPLHFARTRRVS